MSRRRIGCSILVCAMLAGPSVAYAQGDVAVGYNALYLFGSGGAPGLTLPAGFFVSGGVRVGRGVLLVGEVADSTKSETFAGVSSNGSLLTYAGGLRIVSLERRGPRPPARPFVEILVGGARVSSSLGGETLFTGDALAILPGAGVDIPIGWRTALRLAGKFELYHVSGSTSEGFRFDVGVAFRAGYR